MTFCNNCGATVENGTTVCPRCGTSLVQSPPPGSVSLKTVSKLHPLAVSSVAVGAVGALVLPVLSGIVAVYMGTTARRQIEASDGTYGGASVARAGIVLGVLNIAIWLLIALGFLWLLRA